MLLLIFQSLGLIVTVRYIQASNNIRSKQITISIMRCILTLLFKVEQHDFITAMIIADLNMTSVGLFTINFQTQTITVINKIYHYQYSLDYI